MHVSSSVSTNHLCSPIVLGLGKFADGDLPVKDGEYGSGREQESLATIVYDN